MISDGSDNEALIGLEAKDCFELLDKRGLKYTAETLTDKKPELLTKNWLLRSEKGKTICILSWDGLIFRP